MRFPKLYSPKIKEHKIENFEGINRAKVIGDTQFSDALNMSCHSYPALCVRKKESVLYNTEVFEAKDIHFIPEDDFSYFYNTAQSPRIYSFYRQNKLFGQLEHEDGLGDKNMDWLNKELYVIKGSMAYSLDLTEKSFPQVVKAVGRDVTVVSKEKDSQPIDCCGVVSLVYDDFSEIGQYHTGSAEAQFPKDAAVGDIFCRGGTQFYRMTYLDSVDSTKNEWEAVGSLRLRIALTSGYNFFEEGDLVKLSDLKYWLWKVRELEFAQRFVRIERIYNTDSIETQALDVCEEMNDILCKMEYPTNQIYGYNNPEINNSGNALPLLGGKISACMPQMDMICASGNRLWGCSSEANEIYASELGCGRNWSVFENTAGDSFAVSVGSKGDFTACTCYKGHPVFFKENEMIVIGGTRPASYQISRYSCTGVAPDSPDGITVTGDALYYKGYDGVYVYTSGASPKCISYDLCDDMKELCNVRLCVHGDTLYVSGKKGEGYCCYTYDLKYGIWHRRDMPRCLKFIQYPDGLAAMTESEGVYTLQTVGGDIPEGFSAIGEEEVINWYFQSGEIYYSTPCRKLLYDVSIHCSIEDEADVYVEYDGCGIPEHICHLAELTRQATVMRLVPKKCHSFKIFVKGKGEGEFYLITQRAEEVKENG